MTHPATLTQLFQSTLDELSEKNKYKNNSYKITVINWAIRELNSILAYFPTNETNLAGRIILMKKYLKKYAYKNDHYYLVPKFVKCAKIIIDATA